MKNLKELVEKILKKNVPYQAHTDFGSKKKMVLARKSPSSSGGNGGNGSEE